MKPKIKKQAEDEKDLLDRCVQIQEYLMEVEAGKLREFSNAFSMEFFWLVESSTCRSLLNVVTSRHENKIVLAGNMAMGQKEYPQWGENRWMVCSMKFLLLTKLPNPFFRFVLFNVVIFL